ncbi:flavin reductase [Massilia sp. DWR3-1-1]|uniref:flavin reductase n=1 Tax=Massilia sp. DWR3-1-1 TaxID=2804559 RepID=UPI003CF6E0EC
MTDQFKFREGMSRLVGAVTVITTDGPAGAGGFTASAVCSVTDDPPMLVVCMNRNSRQHQVFSENGVLCVNVLTAEQELLSKVFASAATVPERFQLGQWSVLDTGAPALQRALVNFDTRIAQTIEAGTHSIFLCNIVTVRMDAQANLGLAYFGRQYHPVGAQATCAQ